MKPATALIIMDFQRGIVSRHNGNSAVEVLTHAIAEARRRDMLLVFVRVAFRPGYPEVSPANRTFSALPQSGGGLVDDTFDTELHPAFNPASEDVLMVKKRVSAFAGSDLAVVLRARGITDLVLAGIATGGVVLSTVREAADRDYRLTVLADACAHSDDEVHRVLLGKVFPRQADVLTVAEWTARLGPE